MGQGPCFLMARPQSPAHLNASRFGECLAHTLVVPHTGRAPCHPPRKSCTRSFPFRMSRMKSLTGCKVVVRIEESMTVITQA